MALLLLLSYFVAKLLVCFLWLLIPHEVEVRREAFPSLLAYSSQLSNNPWKNKLEKLYCIFISSQDNCTACRCVTSKWSFRKELGWSVSVHPIPSSSGGELAVMAKILHEFRDLRWLQWCNHVLKLKITPAPWGCGKNGYDWTPWCYLNSIFFYILYILLDSSHIHVHVRCVICGLSTLIASLGVAERMPGCYNFEKTNFSYCQCPNEYWVEECCWNSDQ